MEGREAYINFRTEGWREQQRSRFEGVLKKSTQEAGSKIGETLTIEVGEHYDPNIENAYIITGSVKSGYDHQNLKLTLPR